MAARRNHKTVVGKVASDRMNKTISVRCDRLVKHPLYGKYVRRWTVYKAHDEENQARVGDTVQIMATRPLSKTKSWRLVRVLERATTPSGAQESVGEAAR